MTPSLRALAAVLLALPLTLVAAPRAAACSCVQVSPELALEEHDAVFEGRVVSVTPGQDPSQPTVAVLEVVQRWKGVEAEQVEVRTAAMESMCGIAFAPETSWLVYADLQDGTLRTGLCSRTRRIESAEEDLAVLGAGVVPVEIGDDDEVEAPAERTPPARGGCASCAVGASSAGDAGLVGAALALALWLRRRARH